MFKSTPSDTIPELNTATRYKAQSNLLYSNLVGNTGLQLLTGPLIIVLMAEVLHFDALKSALMLAVVPLISLLRIPMAALLRNYGRIKVILLARVIQIICIAVLIFAPASLFNFWIIAGIVMTFIFSRECLFMVVWGQTIVDYTTDGDRGNFIGRMRFSYQLMGIVFDATMIPLIGMRMSLFDFKIAAAFVMLMLFNALFRLKRIPPVPEKKKSPRVKINLMFVKKLFRSKLLRKTLLISATNGFLDSSLMILYFTQILRFPAFLIITIVLIEKVGTVFSIYFWGKLYDTVGMRIIVIGTSCLLLFHPVILLFIQPYRASASASVIVAIASVYYFSLGVFKAGFGIGVTGMQSTSLNDSKESFYAYNLLGTILQIFSTLLILAAGNFIQLTDGLAPIYTMSVQSFSVHMDMFKVGYILLSMILTGGGIVVLLKEKQDSGFEIKDFFSGIIHNPAGLLIFRHKTEHKSEEERVGHARWLASQKTPLALPQLYQLMDDSAFDVKTEAIRSLAFFPGKEPAARLRAILADPDRAWLWDSVAWALGVQRDNAAAPALIKFLSPDYSTVMRSLAARALGKIGNPTAIKPLCDTLQSEPTVLQLQASCCRALMRLKAYHVSDYVVEAFTRVNHREERFELMMTLSEWMKLPQIWLIRSNSTHSTWEILDDHLEWESDKFKKMHAETIRGFKHKDQKEILGRLDAYLDSGVTDNGAVDKKYSGYDGEDRMIQSIVRQLRRHDIWIPLHVLATVFLLYRAEYRQPAAYHLLDRFKK